MTAILGFKCTDGVLLLADTEESVGTTKSECEKLKRLQLPHGVAVLGSAGDSHLIDYATFQASQRLLQKPFTNWSAVHNEINGFAKRITAEVVSYYRGFDLSQLPTIGMLVALQPFQQGVQMYRWLNNTVVPIIDASAAVGAGMEQMLPMLSELDDKRYNPYSVTGTCEAMLFQGVRIMRQTKRLVPFCGKRTEAITLTHDGRSQQFGVAQLEKLEQQIEGFEQYCNGMLASLVSWALTDEQFKAHVSGVSKALRTMRQEYAATVGPLLMQQVNQVKPKASVPRKRAQPRRSDLKRMS